MTCVAIGIVQSIAYSQEKKTSKEMKDDSLNALVEE
jgi:hypothetical protein